ncbi:MAG: hypothetical protein KC457_17200 [Myxococcales bacterium]|nr:hypothetical protein [Myxococcales bacterium]
MSDGIIRTTLAVLLGILILLWPDAAEAAKPYGVVTVDLRPEVGDVPTHLCVVSQGEGPRTRQRLSELLLGGGRAPEESAGEAGPSAPGEDDDRIVGELIVDPSAWGGNPDDQACEAGGACLPQVELPLAGAAADELWVACTTDSLVSDRSPRDPRILFMMLEHLEGSPPAIESVALAGGVVTIGVEANLRRIVVTARTLGGHYEPMRRSVRAEGGGGDNKLVVLPIAPRCHGVEVELPGVRVRESDRDRLVLRANDAPLDPKTCVGPLRGSARMHVQLPRAEGFGRLEVELPPTAEERPTTTRFAGGWDTAWPEGKLRLEPHRIAFVWNPPACVWPTGTCPEATLEGGVSCSATPLENGSCQYLCPGDDDEEWVELTSPLSVTFERKDLDQRWNEILQRPGQTLGAYVDGDQIYLQADISQWRTEVPGSRISHVELYDAEGGVRRYAVGDADLGLRRRKRGHRDELKILAPGASCDPLRFSLVGDRRYRESAAAVRDGKVEFGDVSKTARLLTFNLTLAQGGGLVLAYGGPPPELSNPVYFIVLGQVGANFRPRNPKWSRFAFEMRIGGTLGQWGYYGAGSLGEETRRVSNKVAWARILFEPAALIDIVPPLALGVGVAVGGSWPIDNREQINTDRFPFVVAPSAEARLTIRRWVSLMVQGRAIFGEKTLVATEIIGDTPRIERFPNVSMVGLYGLLFSF